MRFIKALVIYKYQRFEDNKSKKIELRVWKHKYVNVYDNEEGQDLDEYKNEGDRYISFPFSVSYPPLCKESNYSIDLDKRIKSLNDLVYISIICQSDNDYLCIRVTR